MADSATLLGSEAHDRPATVAPSVDLIAHREASEHQAFGKERPWRHGRVQ